MDLQSGSGRKWTSRTSSNHPHLCSTLHNLLPVSLCATPAFLFSCPCDLPFPGTGLHEEGSSLQNCFSPLLAKLCLFLEVCLSLLIVTPCMGKAAQYAGCEMSVVKVQLKLLQCPEMVNVAAQSLTHSFSWTYCFWGMSQLAFLFVF